MSSESGRAPRAVPPPLPEDGSPPRPVLKSRYVDAIREELEARSGGCLQGAVLAFVFLMGATAVLLARAIRMFRRWREERALVRPLRDALRFAEAADVVMAFPLMVNRVLRQPGDRSAAGLFLISFDPEYANSFGRMAELVVLVGAGTSASLSPSDRAFCEALMDNEAYVPFRRRQLPTSITAGGTVYAVDVALNPTLLWGRRISDEMPIVPCMAEPGADGRILQLPYWFFSQAKTQDAAEQVAFVEMVTSLDALALLRREHEPTA